jgi:hypothetical protein
MRTLVCPLEESGLSYEQRKCNPMETTLNEHLKVDESYIIQNNNYLKDLLGGRSLKRLPQDLEICTKTLKTITKISEKRQMSIADVVWRLLQISDIVDDDALDAEVDFKMAGFRKTSLKTTPDAIKKFTGKALKHNVETSVLLHVCTKLLIKNMKHADDYEYKVIEQLASQVGEIAYKCDSIYKSFQGALGYYPPGLEISLLQTSESLFEIGNDLRDYLNGNGWHSE